MNSPSVPAFFEDAPSLLMRDPLAALLGAAEGGIMRYGYVDAVRLAGHSCPTVAGAYLTVRRGLRVLYGDEIPERGNIEVHMRDARDHGTTGVVAAVATLLTGAAAETGFRGIGADGRFARRNLLFFDASIDGLLALRLHDSGRGVQLDLDTSRVPADPEMAKLLPQVIADLASAEQVRRFGALWQDRVRRMLIEHADDPLLVRAWEWVR
ncbi:Formylmethanofuran dehydrogenase subunit E domain-containing protein OS=Afipia felis OX=1035 GN=BN961_00954 PE=4 SV=1 [Afipia felis]